MKHALLASLVLVQIVAVAPRLAAEEYAEPFSTGELVRRAKHIVFAQCTRVETATNAVGHLYTTAAFDTIQLIKGSLPAAFQVRVPGGTLGDVHEDGPYNLSNIATGEQVILFLGPDGPQGMPMPMPGPWTYHTAMNQRTGMRVVTTPISDLELIDARTGGPLDAPADGSSAGGPLDGPAQPYDGLFRQALAGAARAVGIDHTAQDLAQAVTVKNFITSIQRTFKLH